MISALRLAFWVKSRWVKKFTQYLPNKDGGCQRTNANYNGKEIAVCIGFCRILRTETN